MTLELTDVLIQRRLANQGLTRPRFRTPADVVAWFGAVQAQEYLPSKWGVGLRMPRAVDADVERAIADGEILRTHVMRPTWHYVAAADLVWMQRLTAARVHRAMQVYLPRLELDPPLLRRAAAIFERALRDGRQLTRAALAERLRRAGIALSGIRLAHAAMYAELEAVICSGARAGKESTYALVAERVRAPRDLAGDEALAELTRRFVRSHGPATIRDFVWWSGLRTADARRGLDIIGAVSRVVDGVAYWMLDARAPARDPAGAVHLLPIYDEYLVAYRDRVLVPHGPPRVTARRGYVTFQHALVIDGRVAGTWRTARGARDTVVTVVPLRRLTARETDAIAAAGTRYARFLGAPVSVKVVRHSV
jgi:hypothetical protein